MQKRTVVIASVLAGVVLLGTATAIAGPIVYRDLIVGEAESAPTLTAAPTASAGAATIDPADLSGAWAVTVGSYAGYRVDEVLNGVDVTVVGRTEEVTGTLTVEDLTLTDAEIIVDVDSIATDQEGRDAYFRDNALRTSEFPEATFTLTGPVNATTPPVVGEVQTVSATGDLTIAGVTREVTVELQAVLNEDGGQVAGSIPITFADFGVVAPNLGFVSVEPQGFVEFSLVIVPA